MRTKTFSFASLTAAVALGCAPATTSPPTSTRQAPVEPTAALAAPSAAAASEPASTSTTSSPLVPEVRDPTPEELARYPWLRSDRRIRALDATFAPPPGFSRVAVEPGTFAAFLRGLPLRPAATPVRAHTGEILRDARDPRIAAVAELDVGPRDLQQCADSVIRLHAEWLWGSGRASEIRYVVTSGDLAPWSRWAAGDRPTIEPQKLTWGRAARPDASRASFARYLDLVFGYAGTASLAAHSQKPRREELVAGDFFVLPGSPGHAVLVLDVAADEAGRKVALLGQGFMPAQDFHVLASEDGPWFSLENDAIDTPFWPVPFPWSSLRRL